MGSRIKLPDDYTEMDERAMMQDGGAKPKYVRRVFPRLTPIDEAPEISPDLSMPENIVDFPPGGFRHSGYSIPHFYERDDGRLETLMQVGQRQQQREEQAQRRTEVRTTLGCIGGGAFIIGAVVGLTLLFDD